MNKPIKNGTFPASKEEAAMSAKNLVAMIHSPEIQKRVVQTLQQSPDPNAIGQLIGMIIQRLLGSVRTQMGKKPHIKLVLNLIKAAIAEISLIGKQIGVEIPQEMHKQIATVAGNIIEQMSKKQPMQPQQQQQAQPQQAQPQQPAQGQQMQPEGLLGGMA